MYDKNRWEHAAAFHGHKCPGLAIGFKAAEAVVELSGSLPSKDEEIVCITENDTCAVDAVQALIGCTIGKGNLIYRSFGKMAFNFYFRETGKSFRLYYKGETGDLPKDERIEYILNTPWKELFSVTETAFPIPERARLFASAVCTACGEKAREDKVRLVEGKPYCLHCFDAYDR